MQTLAIVGASLAGLSAARAARAQGFTGRLVVIGDEPHRPYDRPPLSKDFLLGTITAEDLYLESEADELEAEWLLGSGGRFPGRRIAHHPAEGRPGRPGGRHRHRHRRPGAPAAHPGRAEQCVHPADPRGRPGLAPELVPGSRMVVIGAGFIGAEVASAAVSRGHGSHHDRHQARAVRRASSGRRWEQWWPGCMRRTAWS